MKFFSYSEADEVLTNESISISAEGKGGPLKAVQLRFTLPTSAYATMLLREILPIESSTSGDYQKNIETC